MVIEWLKIKVAPELRETFVQKDAEIWTPTLAKYPGFLGKQVWLDPKQPDEVVLVIQWESRTAWDAVNPKDLEETEQKFTQAMGKDTYELVEAKEYQIRKFSPTN